MYCSAVYPSVHIQWTQLRFVTHVLFCCLPLSTHTMDPDPVQIVTHVLFCCLPLSAHTVDPVQICYPCIVLLFTPQYTYSGPSTDWLHMYCSAAYPSVHIQWTQLRFVTHVLFYCLPLSTHTVDPVQICYRFVTHVLFCCLPLSTHTVDQFRFVTHVLFCCLPLSTHTVDPVSDLLHMYCSAVYTSVHIQWTQLRFVTHVLFCCLPLSAHTVDPVEICYTCIVLLLTPQYTYSGPSSDLLHMYCSAAYTLVHIQWTQFRFVTHVLFCCLHLSAHTVDPVEICYTFIVLLFTSQCTYSGPS